MLRISNEPWTYSIYVWTVKTLLDRETHGYRVISKKCNCILWNVKISRLPVLLEELYVIWVFQISSYLPVQVIIHNWMFEVFLFLGRILDIHLYSLRSLLVTLSVSIFFLNAKLLHNHNFSQHYIYFIRKKQLFFNLPKKHVQQYTCKMEISLLLHWQILKPHSPGNSYQLWILPARSLPVLQVEV